MNTKKNTITMLKVKGSEKSLYSLIGPLVMNPAVLSLNDNYPFRNTDNHVWYIACDKKKNVLGFLSVLNNTISNDFTFQNQDTLKALLEEAMADMKQGSVVHFMAHKDELPLLQQLGFETNKAGVKNFKTYKTI